EHVRAAILAAAKRRAGQGPAGLDLFAEHRGDLGLEPGDRQRVVDVGDDGLVLAVEAAADELLEGLAKLVEGVVAIDAHRASTSSASCPKSSDPIRPRSLRINTKLWLRTPSSRVVRTDRTHHLPANRRPTPLSRTGR